MISENGMDFMSADQFEDRGAIGTAIDEVTCGDEPIPGLGVKGLQEGGEFMGTPMHVADDEGTAAGRRKTFDNEFGHVGTGYADPTQQS